jgi:uncharacterized protein
VLRARINDGLKGAMKAKDQRRVSTLRMVNAAIKDRDIEARGAGREPLSDQELMGLFQKLIKQRQESLAIYEQAGRQDLAAQERQEIEIISTFLPQPMSRSELRGAVEAAIREVGAAGMKDMGKVMAVLKGRHAGTMDFAEASKVAKSLLGG